MVHTAALHAPHVGVYEDSEFFEEIVRLLDAHIPEVLPAQAAENIISE